MGILLGFAPFILFALLTSVSVSLALWVGVRGGVRHCDPRFRAGAILAHSRRGKHEPVRAARALCRFHPTQPVDRGGAADRRWRAVRHRGLFGAAALSLHHRLCARRSAGGNVGYPALPAHQLHHHLCVVRGIRGDVRGGRSGDIQHQGAAGLDAAAGLAALFAAIVFTARYPIHVWARSERPRARSGRRRFRGRDCRASVPIPKFATSRYRRLANFGIERTLAID